MDNSAEAAQLKRQADSEASLKRGGLPLNAVERLQHQRSTQNTPHHLWTSDLSVAELALTRDAGYEPLGQVMGASIFKVGLQWRSQNWRNDAWKNGASYELDTLTAAFARARQLATGRLQQEAQLLGADGVVGVRLHKKMSDSELESVEFQAIGTAIRLRGRRNPTNETPFLCSLSGQDFWKLKQAGISPVGLVAGNSTYYCIPGIQTQRVVTFNIFTRGSLLNQEMPEYTEALYHARELALDRVADQARALKAHGTVGMEIEWDAKVDKTGDKRYARVTMIYHFLALGTAVRVEARAPEIETSRVLSLEFMPIGPNAKRRSKIL